MAPIPQPTKDLADRPGDTTSANEAMVDLLYERAIDLLRLEAGTRNKVFKFLNSLEGEIVALIAKIDPSGTPAAVVQRIRLDVLRQQVDAAIQSTYRKNDTLLAQEVREVGDIEATWTANAINASVHAEFADVGITRQFLDTLVSEVLIQGAPTREWWERQAGGLSDRFADEMRRGVAIGEPLDKLIARVRGDANQRGIMDVARSSAERLVRSSVQTAANVARESTYENNADLIKALQWSATLDTRTSIWCITRDGHQYDVKTKEAKDGGPPWLSGPGKLHWNALVEGTRILTKRGSIPIEQTTLNDFVLTHTGQWKPVLDKRAKRLEGGIIRVIHTESGRVLRATDDHPVRLANGQWVFVGALEIGDELLTDSESVSEVVGMVIDAETKDCPVVSNEATIAIKRTLQLVAPDVNFESDPQVGYREIEDRCIEMVLRNPSIVECDESVKHHLFALGHVLAKVGCERLGDLLSLFDQNGSTSHKCAHSSPKTGSLFGFKRFLGNARHLTRVLICHSLGMIDECVVRFLGQPPRPMFATGGCFAASGLEVELSLFKLGSNFDSVTSCVGRKASVRQVFRSLDLSERPTDDEVLFGDKQCESLVYFRHDRIIATGMVTINANVYDLEVEDDCSYVANGLVVSNCRSTSVPVMKSWRDLGIDADEVPLTTRASMDGQVAAGTTFEQWLKKQSIARQNTVLGDGKAALWRSGKIDFRDLLDQNGRPLTTEQLRAKAARRSKE